MININFENNTIDGIVVKQGDTIKFDNVSSITHDTVKGIEGIIMAFNKNDNAIAVFVTAYNNTDIYQTILFSAELLSNFDILAISE